MARKIVVTSGKGGVGKTTVTANLGLALSDFGYRVVLIDVDFGLNNLDIALGVDDKVVYDIGDVVNGCCRLKQALVQHNENKNLYVLPSGSLDACSSITGQNIKLLIESVSSVFDFVIIDCPAGIDIGFHRAVSCCDEAIVVVTPNMSSIKDAYKVINVLKSYKLNSVSVVVNRVRGDLIMDKKMMMPIDIVDALQTELLGVLPEEDEVFLSCGGRLQKRSASSKAYKVLASNLNYENKKMFDVVSKYSGFFGSIRRGIKKGI